MADPTAVCSRSTANAARKNGANDTSAIIECSCEEYKGCATGLRAIMSWCSDAQLGGWISVGEMRWGTVKQVPVSSILPFPGSLIFSRQSDCFCSLPLQDRRLVIQSPGKP